MNEFYLRLIFLPFMIFFFGVFTVFFVKIGFIFIKVGYLNNFTGISDSFDRKTKSDLKVATKYIFISWLMIMGLIFLYYWVADFFNISVAR